MKRYFVSKEIYLTLVWAISSYIHLSFVISDCADCFSYYPCFIFNGTEVLLAFWSDIVRIHSYETQYLVIQTFFYTRTHRANQNISNLSRIEVKTRNVLFWRRINFHLTMIRKFQLSDYLSLPPPCQLSAPPPNNTNHYLLLCTEQCYIILLLPNDRTLLNTLYIAELN